MAGEDLQENMAKRAKSKESDGEAKNSKAKEDDNSNPSAEWLVNPFYILAAQPGSMGRMFLS